MEKRERRGDEDRTKFEGRQNPKPGFQGRLGVDGKYATAPKSSGSVELLRCCTLGKTGAGVRRCGCGRADRGKSSSGKTRHASLSEPRDNWQRTERRISTLPHERHLVTGSLDPLLPVPELSVCIRPNYGRYGQVFSSWSE